MYGVHVDLILSDKTVDVGKIYAVFYSTKSNNVLIRLGSHK